MSSTTGLPLEILLYELHKKSILVDWLSFYNSAIKNGWKVKTIFNRIETATSDVFGPQYRDEVIKRLKFCLKKRNEGL
jgi:hypothetical protein